MPDSKEQSCEELHNIGYRHQLAGEWDKAQYYYEKALTLNPDYAFAHNALAQLRMMQTSFRSGLELYESRFDARDDNTAIDWRGLPFPRWRGETLTGKHLHLWVEQGFGDVIMHAGFLPYLLEQEPARITLSMFPKMMTLFARSFPGVVIESLQDIGSYALSPTLLDTFPQLLEMTQQVGLPINLEPMRQDYERALKRGTPDYCAPMGDLMVYGIPHYIPAQQAAYLIPGPARVAETKQRLQLLRQGRLVGISWHTPNTQSGSVRNIPLEQWMPILKTPNCHFITLQHHISALEIERFCAENGCRVITDPQLDIVTDTEGLAALVACMDEVITIDNSNAHLAGALGVRTTLLLPKGHDFRWPVLQGNHDTLWYGSVKTERQIHPMEWLPVIKRVALALHQRV